MAILLGQASGILGGFARAIAVFLVKALQSNEVEGYKYLTSEASDTATMRLKCYRSITLLIMNFIN